MQKNKRYTKKASIFVNDVIFAHEKNQKLTVVNPEQTIKKKKSYYFCKRLNKESFQSLRKKFIF